MVCLSNSYIQSLKLFGLRLLVYCSYAEIWLCIKLSFRNLKQHVLPIFSLYNECWKGDYLVSVYEGHGFCVVLPVGCNVNFIVRHTIGFCLKWQHSTCPDKHNWSHYSTGEEYFGESDTIQLGRVAHWCRGNVATSQLQIPGLILISGFLHCPKTWQY